MTPVHGLCLGTPNNQFLVISGHMIASVLSEYIEQMDDIRAACAGSTWSTHFSHSCDRLSCLDTGVRCHALDPC